MGTWGITKTRLPSKKAHGVHKRLLLLLLFSHLTHRYNAARGHRAETAWRAPAVVLTYGLSAKWYSYLY